MAILRFIVLQTILSAAIFAAWLGGYLSGAFTGHNLYAVSVVLIICGIGLFLSAAGRIAAAARVRDYLPIAAVIGMQLGLLPALGIMGQALMSSGDPAASVGAFISALSMAMYVSVSALMSFAWLSLTLWLCNGE